MTKRQKIALANRMRKANARSGCKGQQFSGFWPHPFSLSHYVINDGHRIWVSSFPVDGVDYDSTDLPTVFQCLESDAVVGINDGIMCYAAQYDRLVTGIKAGKECVRISLYSDGFYYGKVFLRAKELKEAFDLAGHSFMRIEFNNQFENFDEFKNYKGWIKIGAMSYGYECILTLPVNGKSVPPCDNTWFELFAETEVV